MKKRILSIVLCVVLSFCLSSCRPRSRYQPNYNSYETYYKPLPEMPSYTIDWGAWETIDLGILETKSSFIVTYYTDLEYNNYVGNEWQYGVRYNGEYIKSESKIVLTDSPTEIELVAFATELDDWNDYGTNHVAFDTDTLKVGQKQTKWATVIVRENEGRYTGNTAKWHFEITIERIE